MTAPQYFGLIVRGLGLYWFTWGLTYMPLAFVAHPGSTSSATHYVAVATADMVVGAILLFTADGMAETFYRHQPEKDGSIR